MKLADAKTIRSVDKKAVRLYGLKGLQLMENAGRGVSEAVLSLSEGEPRRVSIIAGKGNNGGDGFVAARHLANAGVEARVFLLARMRELKGDALVNARAWARMGGVTREVRSMRGLDRHSSFIRHSGVIVDAIFGTGLSTPVKGIHASAIEFINGLGKTVVSVDVPSGIDSTTGEVLGIAVKADVTATMAMPKLGLFLYPGRELAGRVEVIDIGVPRSLIEDGAIRWNLTTGEDLAMILRPRAADSHKGTYGHLVVAGGSPGKTGAPFMAAMGAMRAGAGLVTIAAPGSLHGIMEAKTAEVMTAPVPETSDGTLGGASYEALKSLLRGKSALVIGPGAGAGEEMEALMEAVITGLRLPMVIDADGLNSIAGRHKVLRKARMRAVLTPHPGEMARLLGSTAKDVQNDRVGSASTLAKESGSVVVLKGATTVAAAPDGRVYLNPTGNAGLATAGTGDVLSGMIGAFLAGGHGPLEAAVAAVYVHGLAADRIKAERGEAGMMATDLLAVIPGLLNSFAGAVEL